MIYQLKTRNTTIFRSTWPSLATSHSRQTIAPTDQVKTHHHSASPPQWARRNADGTFHKNYFPISKIKVRRLPSRLHVQVFWLFLFFRQLYLLISLYVPSAHIWLWLFFVLLNNKGVQFLRFVVKAITKLKDYGWIILKSVYAIYGNIWLYILL